MKSSRYRYEEDVNSEKTYEQLNPDDTADTGGNVKQLRDIGLFNRNGRGGSLRYSNKLESKSGRNTQLHQLHQSDVAN